MASETGRCQKGLPATPLVLVIPVQQGEAQPMRPPQESQPPLASPFLEERIHGRDQSSGKRRAVAPEEGMI